MLLACSPAAARPRLLFGIGTEANSARGTTLAQTSPIGMLTSWYNGPSDLTWMSGFMPGEVRRDYAAGYAMHLVVYTGDPEVQLSTPYGPACGRAYPLSSGFLDDMRTLAGIFAGSGPLYVTLFTEFETYPCKDNAWAADAPTTNYYLSLKDQYRAAMAIFHQVAPRSRVSLGWGGWQAGYDDPGIGGGRSMFEHFADVMDASDFQSFQAMGKRNARDILAMTRILDGYGSGDVMLAHYKPTSQAAFGVDIRKILTPTYLSTVTAYGLFAFSFMDNTYLAADPAMLQFTSEAIWRYGMRP